MSRHLRALARFATVLGGLALSAAAAAQSSPSAYTSGTRYDSAGRVTGTIAPDPDDAPGPLHYPAMRNSYNNRGLLWKIETGELSTWKSESVAPLSWGSAFAVITTTEYTFDALNRKLTEKRYGSGTTVLTQFSYDTFGRLECTAVRMNPAVYGSLPASACTLGTQGTLGPDRITKNVYDDAGQLLQVREAVGISGEEGSEVTYSYTNNGLKKYVIDAKGNKAELRYDGHDRQVRWVFPSTTPPGSFNDSTPANAAATAGNLNEGDYEAYTYDAAGNRLTLRKRDGRTIAYAYDNLDRVTSKTYPGGGARAVYYAYDLQSRQTGARFDSTSGEGITFTYDGFGNKLTETQALDSASRTLTSSYDRDNDRTYFVYPDGNGVSILHDGLDRPYYALLNGSSSMVYAVRKPNGLLDAQYRWLPGSAAWLAATGFTYDGISRLTYTCHDIAGTTYDTNTSLAYNPASQVTSATRSNDAYAWTGQTGLNRAYTANGLNQYSAVAGAGYCYDANGNLTADTSKVYKYDIENRLTEMRVRTAGDSNCASLGYAGTLQASLRYDPLGRLYETTDNVTSAVTRFLYDGDDLVAEYSGALKGGGTLLRRYVHGSDAGDDPLVRFEGSGVADAA